MSTQDLLSALKHEVLATTSLAMAIDYLEVELRHSGGFAAAMERLSHYFTPFQAYVIREAERDGGRFDFRVALEILEREADYRAKSPTPQGVFVYQFETLCRNRLGYDWGLEATAGDPIFNADWREWINTVRRQVGIVDFADLIYVRSEHYQRRPDEPDRPILFARKEGQIALANRHKDPLLLFAALQRHLGYPSVPRQADEDTQRSIIPQLQRRIERLEQRAKLIEEEFRGGINLAKYYVGKEKGGESA